MSIKNNIVHFQQRVSAKNCQLIAVSKTHPAEKVQEAYDAGQRLFGENKVQEMTGKHELLPADIQWHLIGHLQSNKVKYIVPFVALIHSVDSIKLLEEINRQAAKTDRMVSCLLQVHIAKEETKFGFDEQELLAFISGYDFSKLTHVRIEGLMGMATLSSDKEQIRQEFRQLKKLFDTIAAQSLSAVVQMKQLSMGMSSDYEIAMEEGSTMVRIGTALFGGR